MLTTNNTGGLANRQSPQEIKLMKVKILRNTVANGQPVEVGQIVDVSESDAAMLIGIGKAEAVNEKAIETADAHVARGVAVETADKAKPPTKKTRKP